eukprot:3290910-Rhodomonas_salina.2
MRSSIPKRAAQAHSSARYVSSGQLVAAYARHIRYRLWEYGTSGSLSGLPPDSLPLYQRL